MTAWDTTIALTLVVSLASWLATHAGLALALLRRHRPRWMLWLLLLPPLFWLAPFWGLRYKLSAGVGLWFGCVIVYACALTVAVLSGR